MLNLKSQCFFFFSCFSWILRSECMLHTCFQIFLLHDVYITECYINYHSKKLQIINVYNQEYESAAAFWPDVHGRIISALIFSQVVLMGLLSTKKAAQSTPFLIALPVITIAFHRYCKGRYEPAFLRYPIQVC